MPEFISKAQGGKMRVLDNGTCPFSRKRFNTCVEERCALWSATGLKDFEEGKLKEKWNCAFRVLAEALASLANREER